MVTAWAQLCSKTSVPPFRFSQLLSSAATLRHTQVQSHGYGSLWKWPCQENERKMDHNLLHKHIICFLRWPPPQCVLFSSLCSIQSPNVAGPDSPAKGEQMEQGYPNVVSRQCSWLCEASPEWPQLAGLKKGSSDPSSAHDLWPSGSPWPLCPSTKFLPWQG